MQNNVPATPETFTYVEKLFQKHGDNPFVKFLYNQQSSITINFKIIGNYYFTV